MKFKAIAALITMLAAVSHAAPTPTILTNDISNATNSIYVLIADHTPTNIFNALSLAYSNHVNVQIVVTSNSVS